MGDINITTGKGALMNDEDRLVEIWGRVETVVGFMWHNSPMFLMIALVVFALVILTKMGRWIRESFVWPVIDRQDRDPVRLFSNTISEPYYRVAGWRCEGSSFLIFRCRRQATQADHWFPHSRGGHTSPKNLVVLCKTCNGASKKGGKLPTVLQTMLVEHRRKGYFPVGVSTKISGKSVDPGLHEAIGGDPVPTAMSHRRRRLRDEQY